MERTYHFIGHGLGRLNSWMTAAIFLAGFIWLASIALQREETDMHGNPRSTVDAFYTAQLSTADLVVYLYGDQGEEK